MMPGTPELPPVVARTWHGRGTACRLALGQEVRSVSRLGLVEKLGTDDEGRTVPPQRVLVMVRSESPLLAMKGLYAYNLPSGPTLGNV